MVQELRKWKRHVRKGFQVSYEEGDVYDSDVSVTLQLTLQHYKLCKCYVCILYIWRFFFLWHTLYSIKYMEKKGHFK